MKKGCSVFVGNIDFDVPEEKLIEQLGTIGRVVSFRMVYDHKTKKSKGYGFCEYETKEIAQLAVKSLNISFNNRQVKINYAENDMKRKNNSWKIEDVLKKMDKVNLLDVLKYLKTMAVNNTGELRRLLRNEHFCALVVGVLVKLGLVDEEGVCEIVGRGMGIEGGKEHVLMHILQVKEEELGMYDEHTRERIMLLKNMLIKKE
ncbi:mRNA cleavage and polyadenylation factor I complex, subunit RNA15 [Trachipleistophora hominis]|uniref:mRNA cleavage and polyadenylation factor I complex, subunit RNA15 n=1 Tax=Trachipleistophora hominis TaxID=72359 RepID=L7JV53_TRAHO|nr:mRNA cleavage and polyadenylation factor I complex, subunit RNA15 [Trachipleistophora hominis]